MEIVAKRNLVFGGKTYRDGDVIEGLGGVQIEKFIRDGLVAYREVPANFAKMVSVDDKIEALDPEKKPSKRKE